MDHEGILVKCIAAYVVAIFSIKFVMGDKKPFGLQGLLTVWNALLAVFSIAGFVRMTPTMINVITGKGLAFTYTDISEVFTDK
jgi:hypothetical protein